MIDNSATLTNSGVAFDGLSNNTSIVMKGGIATDGENSESTTATTAEVAKEEATQQIDVSKQKTRRSSTMMACEPGSSFFRRISTGWQNMISKALNDAIDNADDVDDMNDEDIGAILRQSLMTLHPNLREKERLLSLILMPMPMSLMMMIKEPPDAIEMEEDDSVLIPSV